MAKKKRTRSSDMLRLIVDGDDVGRYVDAVFNEVCSYATMFCSNVPNLRAAGAVRLRGIASDVANSRRLAMGSRRNATQKDGKVEWIREAIAEAQKSGMNERKIAGHVAEKFGVTSRHVRQIRKPRASKRK